MSSIDAQVPKPLTLLRLGRVSNLPTVWTNVIAGATVAAPDAAFGRLAAVALAMTVFYVGGMYLNDYFDREIDARERPNRPISAGEISAATVLAIGSGLLLAGIAILLPIGLGVAAWGVALCGTILLYDSWHKGNALGPVIMSLCRALVYLAAGSAVGAGSNVVLVAWSAVLAAHVIGLTYAAKQESLNQIGFLWPLVILALPLFAGMTAIQQGWPVLACLALLALTDGFAVWLLVRRSQPKAVPRAVSMLIAAISIVDALVVASNGGGVLLTTLCVSGYVITRVLQKFVPGT